MLLKSVHVQVYVHEETFPANVHVCILCGCQLYICQSLKFHCSPLVGRLGFIREPSIPSASQESTVPRIPY